MIRKFRKTTRTQMMQYFKLRLQGYSFPVIAFKFNRDHSSIMYWCNLYGVTPIVFLNGEVKRKIILKRKGMQRLGVMPRKIIITIKKDLSILKIKHIYDKSRFQPKTKLNQFQLPKQQKPKQICGDGIKTCMECGKKKTDKRWIATRYCSLMCWVTFNYIEKRKYY